MKEEVIKARNLTIGYQDDSRSKHIVQSALSFSLYRGEVTSLLGTNGSGKSTLLRTLSRTLTPLSGELFLENRPIDSFRESSFAQTLGLVLTEKGVAGGLTARELTALGRYPYTGFFGHLSPTDEAIISRSLSEVGMLHKAECAVAHLSDGERQKIFIAKALAQECPIILLDEPTAFLDVASRIETMHLLHRLASEQGKTILLSTHDIEQALLLSDRLWILREEAGMECGVTEDIVLSESFKQAFCRGNIRFDTLTGAFRIAEKPHGSVFLQGDPALCFWGENALRRNGIGTTLLEEEATCRLTMEASHRIQVTLQGESSQTLSSFESLLSLLQAQKRGIIS